MKQNPNYYKYKLEKYRRNNRYECPGCHRHRCFTRYVDPAGNYLANHVGRCDHESSCGYHYTPKQYFQDNPNKSRRLPEYSPPRHTIAKTKQQHIVKTIPDELIRPSICPEKDSNLTAYLKTIFPSEDVMRAVNEYLVGVTDAGETIFYEIDIEGHCRTGKIMAYGTDGHRVKDLAAQHRIDWVHTRLRQQLPSNYELAQCLYGEHLLAKYPDKPVALVESEKTAVICSIVMPQYVWLATGGKSNLNNRVLVLRGRRVVVFPDADAIDDWRRKVTQYPGVGFVVSTLLDEVPEDQRLKNMDIADWVIEYYNKHIKNKTND